MQEITFGRQQPRRNFPAKKLAVLKEAARAFVEKGVVQTSLDDIAERLKVTKPAIYYYVKSKEEIIGECLALGHQYDEENILRIAALPVDGLKKLREMMLYYGRAIHHDVFGHFLATVDQYALSETGLAKHRESQRYLFEASRRMILEGIDDGSIRPCDPTTVTFAMVGALNSTTRWFDPKGPRSIDSVIEEIWELIRTGVEKAPR